MAERAAGDFTKHFFSLSVVLVENSGYALYFLLNLTALSKQMETFLPGLSKSLHRLQPYKYSPLEEDMCVRSWI